MLKHTLASLLLITTPLMAHAQTPVGNAGVAVVSVEDGSIYGANNIDDQVPANLAGRLAFFLLVHEWLDLNEPDRMAQLPGADPGFNIQTALPLLLIDGRGGEMARATMAARIGYTPAFLNAAMERLFAEMGVSARGVAIQRGAYGGPEWSGTITVRDTARVGLALARLHGEDVGSFVAGAGLQCVSLSKGFESQERMIGVVSGAASAEGCLQAAKTSVNLTDTRIVSGERVDKLGSDETPEGASEAFNLPPIPKP